MTNKELVNKNGRGSTELIGYISDSEEFYKVRIPEECELEIGIDEIRKNGLLIQCVEEQDEELCMEAVIREPIALKFVKQQTLDICKEAVKGDIYAIDFVEEKYFDELCKELDILYLPKGEKNSRLLIRKINHVYYCWIGGRNCITLGCLLHEIYFEDGGLFKNPDKQVYLDFLKDNGLIESQLLDSSVPLPDFDEEVDWI